MHTHTKKRVPNVYVMNYTNKIISKTWLKTIGFIAVTYYSVSIMNIRKRGHKVVVKGWAEKNFYCTQRIVVGKIDNIC